MPCNIQRRPAATSHFLRASSRAQSPRCPSFGPCSPSSCLLAGLLGSSWPPGPPASRGKCATSVAPTCGREAPRGPLETARATRSFLPMRSGALALVAVRHRRLGCARRPAPRRHLPHPAARRASSVPRPAEDLTPLTNEQLATKLLELTGATHLGKQVMDSMAESFGKLPGLPPGFLDRFNENAHTEELTALLVPIYVKSFDRETLTAAIQFYDSRYGRSLIAASAWQRRKRASRWGRRGVARWRRRRSRTWASRLRSRRDRDCSRRLRLLRVARCRRGPGRMPGVARTPRSPPRPSWPRPRLRPQRRGPYESGRPLRRTSTHPCFRARLCSARSTGRA